MTAVYTLSRRSIDQLENDIIDFSTQLNATEYQFLELVREFDIRRGWEACVIEIYRVPLREPLPVIAIPLRETDNDVPLALQPVLEQCYAGGRYDDLDYTTEPDPPLEPPDAAWADALLREKGLR